MRWLLLTRDFLISIVTGLVQDEHGRFSHSKFWSNIAYGVCTWLMITITLDGKMTVDFMLWYLVIAGGHSAIAKYINARQSGSYQFPDYSRYRREPDDSVDTLRQGGAKTVE